MLSTEKNMNADHLVNRRFDKAYGLKYQSDIKNMLSNRVGTCGSDAFLGEHHRMCRAF